ncbi:MAG: hypothetical protein AAF725_16410 [Acidobacteriota bacterium]
MARDQGEKEQQQDLHGSAYAAVSQQIGLRLMQQDADPVKDRSQSEKPKAVPQESAADVALEEPKKNFESILVEAVVNKGCLTAAAVACHEIGASLRRVEEEVEQPRTLLLPTYEELVLGLLGLSIALVGAEIRDVISMRKPILDVGFFSHRPSPPKEKSKFSAPDALLVRGRGLGASNRGPR